MSKRVGVAVIIIDDGKVLLSKRGENARNDQGMWENVGGAVEAGETAEEAIAREAREEIGVELVDLERLFEVDNVSSEWSSVHFTANIDGEPKIMEPDRCAELRWVELSELKDLPLSPYAHEDFVRLGYVAKSN